MDESVAQRTRVVLILYGHLGQRGNTYHHRRAIRRYLERLAATCGQMTLIARVEEVLRDEPRLSSPLSSGAIEVRPIQVSAGRLQGVRVLWKAFLEVRRALAASRISGERPVVFAFAPGPVALAAALARRLDRFPFVVYFGLDWEAVEVSDPGRRRAWLRSRCNGLFQRFIGRSADAAICAGEALLAKIGRLCGDSYRTIPILDFSGLGPSAEPRARGRPRDDPESGAPTLRFLYVGTLSPRKGVMDLVAAFARLRQERAAIRLDVVGDGPERSRIESRVRELAVEDAVDFHGYVAERDELFDLYAAADAFVLPSYNEGFPRVLYEAASAGLPIIATAVGGVPAVLEDGKHALLVSPGDVDGLCDAMRTLASDSGLRADMSRRNSDLSVAARDRDAVQQHAEVLRSVLGDYTA